MTTTDEFTKELKDITGLLVKILESNNHLLEENLKL
jgi:hypothetical protein